LEDTNVSNERLISLILLIALAYTGATIKDNKLNVRGTKYVGRVKEYGRTERRHSSFMSDYMVKIGLIWNNVKI